MAQFISMSAMPAPSLVSSSLVCDLHGLLLRLIAVETGMHFSGLRSAAAHCRRQRLLPNTVAKKLARIDDAFAVVRHITVVSAEQFVEDVQRTLRNGSRPDVPRHHDPPHPANVCHHGPAPPTTMRRRNPDAPANATTAPTPPPPNVATAPAAVYEVFEAATAPATVSEFFDISDNVPCASSDVYVTDHEVISNGYSSDYSSDYVSCASSDDYVPNSVFNIPCASSDVYVPDHEVCDNSANVACTPNDHVSDSVFGIPDLFVFGSSVNVPDACRATLAPTPAPPIFTTAPAPIHDRIPDSVPHRPFASTAPTPPPTAPTPQPQYATLTPTPSPPCAVTSPASVSDDANDACASLGENVPAVRPFRPLAAVRPLERDRRLVTSGFLDGRSVFAVSSASSAAHTGVWTLWRLSHSTPSSAERL